MSNSLTIPLYASKPQRRIPGTNAVAVTLYKSHDGTVAEYAVFSADGEAYLGHPYLQTARGYRTRGYTMTRCPAIMDEKWRTLTEFALEMAKRLEVEGIAA